MIVLLDRFVFNGTRPYIEEARQEAAAEAEWVQAVEPAVSSTVEYPEEAPGIRLAELPPPEEATEDIFEEEPVYAAEDEPLWRKNAVPAAHEPGQARVVIVIDDLGVSRGYSQEIIELPGPLTLAFLPYAGGLQSLVDEGRGRGHEIMVHMPMEPMDPDLDMGGIFLSEDQSPAEFDEMLERGLSAFEGYTGLNNHMGSRLTQDREAMEQVMATLYRRGLLFLDSRTIPSSVAAETAAAYQVPYAVRDVFLDDENTLENVRAQLVLTESMALEHGQAIAIGHPRPHTITALKEWLPTLEEKGIALVPISGVVITEQPSSDSAALFGPPAPQHQ